ncbi:RNA polymerase sigma factor [Egicoccus sp. AB-alg6-2]|uniref:RNA polymerase sigma factor n=1 Tax=Egicoccus sp. AB-alg6-2 TaxID=3242692 RepID=UPI00359EDCDE
MIGEGFEHVLASARRGEEAAWRRFYLELQPALVGYLRGRGCATPEDVASETLLQVVRDLRKFSGTEANFRSWVFSIAHHRMIDAARHTKARPVRPAESEVLEAGLPATRIDDAVLNGLGGAELEHLLSACTPDQRDVLLLCYVADLSLHQAAEVLDKEYNAVKALHRRAISALRDQLDDAKYPRRGQRSLTSSA